MARDLQFVFFDVGSTLLFANRERMLAPLHACGIRPSEDQLLTLERTVKNQFDDILEHDGKADHGFWELFYARLFEELGVRDEPLRRVVIANPRNSQNWDRIRPGTRAALDRIGEQYGMAVISNADGRIAELLARRGIADCFRSITDSGIVGQEKPHRVIFETALASVGASAEQSLYVGDVYSVDYRGAIEVGMDGVLFDVCGAYRDKWLPRVESLEELAVLLGCGRKSSSAPEETADINRLRHR